MLRLPNPYSDLALSARDGVTTHKTERWSRYAQFIYRKGVLHSLPWQRIAAVAFLPQQTDRTTNQKEPQAAERSSLRANEQQQSRVKLHATPQRCECQRGSAATQMTIADPSECAGTAMRTQRGALQCQSQNAHEDGQRCCCFEQTSTCAVNAQTFSPSIVIPSFCAWRDCSVKART